MTYITQFQSKHPSINLFNQISDLQLKKKKKPLNLR